MSSSKLCEFCKEDTASFLCVDCEQQICERCKGIHSRQKATRLHAVKSLSMSQVYVEQSLESYYAFSNSQVASLQDDLRSYDVCIEQMISAQTSAIDECKRIRAACHRTLDERFDALEDRIQELTSPRIQRRYEDQAKLKQHIDELHNKQLKLSQTLADNDSKPEDTMCLLTQVKAMLKVKQPPNTFMIPQVSVELNPGWESVQPCHVTSAADTAAKIPARGSDVNDESKVTVIAKQSAEKDSVQQRTERPSEENTKTQVNRLNTLSTVMIDFVLIS